MPDTRNHAAQRGPNEGNDATEHGPDGWSSATEHVPDWGTDSVSECATNQPPLNHAFGLNSRRASFRTAQRGPCCCSRDAAFSGAYHAARRLVHWQPAVVKTTDESGCPDESGAFDDSVCSDETDDVQGETSSGSKKSSGELSSGVVVTLAVVGCVLALVACGLCFVLCGWTREDDVEAQRKFFPAGGSGHSPQSTSWRSRGRGRADGVKQQPSMTAAGRDGDLAPMLGEQGDVTNRMILRPQQPANWSRLLTTGKALVAGLLVAGTAVPGLEGVCNLAVFILYEVEALQNKADDVVAAGERVVKVLEVLKILADNATRLDDDDARGLVERRMGELYDLLEQFSEIVKSFRERGWLRRRWFLYEHGAKLSSLDEEIVRTLDSLRLAYDLSRDRTLTRLLESQRYEMEQAISRQISRLVNAGQTEHDAVLVLADDESATKEVAQAAHVSESEVNLELVAAVASMQTGIDDIKAHVEGLREVVNKKVMRSATKQRKNELLETYEIELDSVDAVPFARGGNSQVHKGTYSGETVVLKRVPLHGYTAAKRARLLADFTDELCIMVNLRHPLVVGFYGVVTKDDPDFLGLCVEYMSGGSLRSKLDDESTQLAWSRRKLWLSQIARGVRYLHSHQIQHRDLKSSNILLSESGTAKVSDFGLSRSEALRTKTTVSGGQGTAAGTAPFMAPELISDNIFTEKSDVYSYGMLVYEVITRERPWDDLSQAQIVMRAALREERPILPAEIYVPPDIVQLMTMCWAHNPDDRPTFADIVRLAFVGSPDDPALVDPFSAESPAHI
ncbi:hypothetical protein CTAYLR_009845 [Chrysophaeum taylorii]|uniref:Protein kinase domain-containing protein n=1 Tax=Chrysophaeum taylorii TaxID=2483200 RepID=A0AAD7XHT4_9STRA|nr:hypothetical protein CTAYLR_009845 [Chrysophaeum taylorii]